MLIKKDNIEKRIDGHRIRKAFSVESIVFLLAFGLFFGYIGVQMGGTHMISTMMNTAFSLLTNTVLYIMAIAVLAGAISALLTEFGIVAALNQLISPLMRPLYGLPGATVVGVLTTYMSDNPAILTLARDDNFKRYFKKYQMPALTNIGTAFGMGLIVTAFMMSQSPVEGGNFIGAAIIGNLGAVIGSLVSTRLMLMKTKKLFGTEECTPVKGNTPQIGLNERIIKEGNAGSRFMDAILEGGKNGVEMGFTIIPGVLIICTLVLILTNGPSNTGAYTGAAFEGIGLLPMLAEKAEFVITPLFGFSSPEAVSVPLTALGAAGAAMGLVPELLKNGLAGGNDIAVFTAMCMCWSGYLSTHVAMMDSLNFRALTGRAIFSHTIGGICAGITAHLMYILIF
jgi:spore maturation protein SpmB